MYATIPPPFSSVNVSSFNITFAFYNLPLTPCPYLVELHDSHIHVQLSHEDPYWQM